MARPGNELAGFGAADPVGDGGLFELDFGTQGAHFRSDVIDGMLGLRRAAEAGTDVVGQVAELVQGVGILEGGVSETGHGGDLCGGPGAGRRVQGAIDALLVGW